MKVNYFSLVVGLAVTVFVMNVTVRGVEAADVRHVSGEITWVDTSLGKLQLKSDTSPGIGEITEYRISEHETRVTNSSDKKFLIIEDLQPGQKVTVDVIDGKEGQIVQKIIANPRPVSDYQEVYGEVESIDGAGKLTLAERPRAGQTGEKNLSYFIFEPKDIVVTRSPSTQPVQLMLNPGDVVKVEFIVKDGNRRADAITVYTPQATRTTTTTTVTTTQ